MQAEYDIDGFEELTDMIDTLEPAMVDNLTEAAEDIGVRLRGEGAKGAPVDTGRLQSDLSHLVESIGNAIIRIKVGSNLDYAQPHETGTDPFFPPPSELRGWAHRVLGDEDLAYVVARSISETGIDESAYMSDALEENWTYVVDRVNTAVEAAFSEAGFS